jgi:voltage-gated potassium channel
MNFTPLKMFQIVGILVLILVAGIAGYHIIEGWNWFDALYMTVITLATVGYGEIHQLSLPGRVFTIFLIFSGMGILLYGVTELTAFMVEGEMTGYLRRRKMNRMIHKLTNHYILCGWGQKGSHVLAELERTKRKCVVIEVDSAKAGTLSDGGTLVVEGDATQDAMLRSAGIERAAGLVTTLPTDKDNLFVVISARGLNPTLRIVAKVDELGAREKFLRSGADTTVSTNYIGGLRMASELVRPDAVNFLDTMLRDNSSLRVEDVRVGAKSQYLGKTIKQCAPLNDSRVILFSIRKNGKDQFNPSVSTPLVRGDVLIVIGVPEQIAQLRTALAHEHSR